MGGIGMLVSSMSDAVWSSIEGLIRKLCFRAGVIEPGYTNLCAEICHFIDQEFGKVMSQPGFEPRTFWHCVSCSNHWGTGLGWSMEQILTMVWLSTRWYQGLVQIVVVWTKKRGGQFDYPRLNFVLFLFERYSNYLSAHYSTIFYRWKVLKDKCLHMSRHIQ